MALQAVTKYQLRTGVWWGGVEQFAASVFAARSFLLRLLFRLAPDVWMNVEALARFIWRVRPDLLALDHGPTQHQRQWYDGSQPLPARQMAFDVWSATFGHLLLAFLAGPAAWLGFIELGRQAGGVVCFRRLSVVDASDTQRLPDDLVQFPTSHTLVLRSAWQAGTVRPLLDRIAVESARDRATSTYRLDAATFRKTLQQGESSQDIVNLFRSRGLSLPPALIEKLALWESRLGNFLLQDKLAAIEFGQDVAAEEVRAIAALGGSRVYQAGPRCLVVLDADDVGDLLDSLRRRGNTPQVME
jgi:hypothetical protein